MASSTPSTAGSSLLLQLDEAFLSSHLLPFVPNAAFYTVLPCLSHAARRLLSSSALHKRQAQQRLSIPDPLWSKMRQRPWVMKEEKDDDEDEGGDEQEEEEGDDEQMADGAKLQSAPSLSEVERDWAVVCRELHRRLTRVERHVFRHAPCNCYGDRYQLPDAVRAFLIDSWTTRLLSPYLPLEKQKGQDWYAVWVLKPGEDDDRQLHYSEEGHLSLSDFPHLAVLVSCTERGTCESLSCCWANPRRFVVMDCGPGKDGRQPADLNSAPVLNWSCIPEEWQDGDEDEDEETVSG